MGDKATNRFHDLRVQEVSLVDAAANEESFLVIKRREIRMDDERDETQTPNPETVESTATEPEVATAPEGLEETLVEKLSGLVEAAVERALDARAEAALVAQEPEAATAPTPEAATAPTPEPPAPAPTPEVHPVDKGAEILDALRGIEATVKRHGEQIAEFATARAVAKGREVEDTESEPTAKAATSKWAGSAVHRLGRR